MDAKSRRRNPPRALGPAQGTLRPTWGEAKDVRLSHPKIARPDDAARNQNNSLQTL